MAPTRGEGCYGKHFIESMKISKAAAISEANAALLLPPIAYIELKLGVGSQESTLAGIYRCCKDETKDKAEYEVYAAPIAGTCRESEGLSTTGGRGAAGA
jgi:hypothetical protein